MDESSSSSGAAWIFLMRCAAWVTSAFLLGAMYERQRREQRGTEEPGNTQPSMPGCAGDPGIGGLRRVLRQRFALGPRPPACEGPLPLQITVAPPPTGHSESSSSGKCGPEPQSPIVVYVLDPEPMLFGAAALFAYGQAPYGTPGTAEAPYRHMYIVGVGHAEPLFSLDGDGFDPVSLRNIRRRDFPPRDHPMHSEGRERNAHAERFVDGLVEEVIPHVEGNILGLSTPPRRAILGASYSAVVALQAMLRHPSAFADFVLGSPSAVFDPEVIDDVNIGSYAKAAQEAGAGVLILLGEKEREGRALPGNVHDDLPSGARMLADALRARGLKVDGVHDITGEDHSTVKLSLVSRGLTWVAERYSGKH